MPNLFLQCIAIIAAISITGCSKQENAQSLTPAVSPLTAGQDVTLAASFAEVTRSGSTWTAKVNGNTVYTGTDYIASIQAAVNNLTAGRTTKETVNIKNSGSSGPSGGVIKAVNIPSYTILEFNGTTFECNSGDALIVPVQGERRDQIEIRNLRVTGNPRYGIWLKTCTNITLTNITMNLTGGLGIRVDDSKGGWSRNLNLNSATITGAGTHAVETYGVDGFTIGTVNATDVAGCGLLLNYSKNGTVGTVNGTRCNPGGGYAAFRIANNAGPNITVSKVYARGCGRGFFSVTGSNGCTINNVDIAGSTSHGMLIENATNVKVLGGTIADCGAEGVRFSQATTYCTVQNLRVYGNSYGVRETSPGNYNNILNCNLTGNDVKNLEISGANTKTTGSTW